MWSPRNILLPRTRLIGCQIRIRSQLSMNFTPDIVQCPPLHHNVDLFFNIYLCLFGNNNIEIVPRNQDVLCQRWEEEGWGQRWRPWQGHWGKPGEKNRPHHLGLLVININQHYQSVFGLWTSLTPHKIPLLRRTDKMLKSSPWHIQNLKTPVHFSLNMKSTFLGHLTFQSKTLARLPGTWLRRPSKHCWPPSKVPRPPCQEMHSF